MEKHINGYARMEALKRKARSEDHLLMATEGYFTKLPEVSTKMPKKDMGHLMGDEEGGHDMPHKREIG